MKTKKLNQFSEIFSDPTRVRIAAILVYFGRCNTTDLANTMGEIVPKINRHLAYFKRFDYLSTEKHNQVVIYDFKDFYHHRIKEVFSVFGIDTDPIIMKDLAAIKRLDKSGDARLYLAK